MAGKVRRRRRRSKGRDDCWEVTDQRPPSTLPPRWHSAGGLVPCTNMRACLPGGFTSKRMLVRLLSSGDSLRALLSVSAWCVHGTPQLIQRQHAEPAGAAAWQPAGVHPRQGRLYSWHEQTSVSQEACIGLPREVRPCFKWGSRRPAVCSQPRDNTRSRAWTCVEGAEKCTFMPNMRAATPLQLELA